MHRGEASSCSFLCSTTHQKNALSGFFRAYFLALGGTLTLPQKSNNACHFSPFQRTHAPRLPAPASPSTTINHHHHRRHHRRRHHHQQHTTKATATIWWHIQVPVPSTATLWVSNAETASPDSPEFLHPKFHQMKSPPGFICGPNKSSH